jgi:hypothetical protein
MPRLLLVCWQSLRQDVEGSIALRFGENAIYLALPEPHLFYPMEHFSAHETMGRWAKMHFVPEDNVSIQLDRLHGAR